MTQESYFRTHRPPAVMYLLSLAGLMITVSLVLVVSFDVWWHLATGQAIDFLGYIPRNDIFSYTRFGAPWTNHEWLFQVSVWHLYKWFGHPGLTALKFLLASSTAVIFFRTVDYLVKSKNVALWATAFFLWNASHRIIDRPHLMGMLMLAVFCLVLHKYVREETRAIWLLPLLQVVWINWHGGGFLGVMVIGAFAAGESIQALIPRNAVGPERVDGTRIRRLWLIAFAAFAACFINPYGADIFPFYFEHLQAKTILAATHEWRPLLHPGIDRDIPPYLTLATLVATLISYIMNAKRARISHLILTAGTALMLTRGHRFGPEFTLVNLPILLLNLRTRFPAAVPASNLRCWVNVAAAFVISVATLTFGLPLSLEGMCLHAPALGAAEHFAPARMVEFLDRHDIRGRVLNDMGIGAYLIFSRWPRERVFIDGRTPVYGDEFFKRYTEAFKNNRNFEGLVEEYAPDYIVLAGFSGWNQRTFHSYLWRHPKWRLVYAKRHGFVYLRDVPKFRELIENLELDEHPVVEEMDRRRSKKGP